MSYLTLHASDVAVLYNKFVCNHKGSDVSVFSDTGNLTMNSDDLKGSVNSSVNTFLFFLFLAVLIVYFVDYTCQQCQPANVEYPKVLY